MSPHTGKETPITAGGFRHLLARLDPDTDRAALEYERLRQALIRFFDWRGAWTADECADEVLDRLGRKLESGAVVDDVAKYAHGIARFVLLERRRDPVVTSIDAVEVGRIDRKGADDPSGDDESVHTCFDRCLMQLPADGRSLLTAYYEGERETKISNRRRLGMTLGLSDNALRSRVQRLRDRVERCMHACLSSVMGRP